MGSGATSIDNTWQELGTQATMTFYSDGTTRDVSNTGGVGGRTVGYKVQEDETLIIERDYGGEEYYDKTEDSSLAFEDRNYYYLENGVLVYLNHIYFIEGDKASENNAQKIADLVTE